jgi:hypothetical protein
LTLGDLSTSFSPRRSKIVVILYSSLSEARVGAGKLESVPERKMTLGGSVWVEIVRKFRALGIGMKGVEFRTALTSDAGIGSKIGVASNEARSGLEACSFDMFEAELLFGIMRISSEPSCSRWEVVL